MVSSFSELCWLIYVLKLFNLLFSVRFKFRHLIDFLALSGSAPLPDGSIYNRIWLYYI